MQLHQEQQHRRNESAKRVSQETGNSARKQQESLAIKQRLQIKQVDADMYHRPQPTEVQGVQETVVGAYSVYGSNAQHSSQQ